MNSPSRRIAGHDQRYFERNKVILPCAICQHRVCDIKARRGKVPRPETPVAATHVVGRSRNGCPQTEIGSVLAKFDGGQNVLPVLSSVTS